jgi:hypothetical protein
MSLLNIKQMIMMYCNAPNNLSHLDNQSMVLPFQKVPLKFREVVAHVVKSLSKFKNRSSWSCIQIEYCYYLQNCISSVGTYYVDLRGRGYLKPIYELVCRLIHHYQLQLIGKLVNHKQQFIPAKGIRGYVVIQKITIYKPFGKRFLKKQLKQMSSNNILKSNSFQCCCCDGDS